MKKIQIKHWKGPVDAVDYVSSLAEALLPLVSTALQWTASGMNVDR